MTGVWPGASPWRACLCVLPVMRRVTLTCCITCAGGRSDQAAGPGPDLHLPPPWAGLGDRACQARRRWHQRRRRSAGVAAAPLARGERQPLGEPFTVVLPWAPRALVVQCRGVTWARECAAVLALSWGGHTPQSVAGSSQTVGGRQAVGGVGKAATSWQHATVPCSSRAGGVQE